MATQEHPSSVLAKRIGFGAFLLAFLSSIVTCIYLECTSTALRDGGSYNVITGYGAPPFTPVTTSIEQPIRPSQPPAVKIEFSAAAIKSGAITGVFYGFFIGILAYVFSLPISFVVCKCRGLNART